MSCSPLSGTAVRSSLLLPIGFSVCQVCRAEHQLFCRFFPSAATNLSVLTGSLMDPLGVILYDHLRPSLIQLQEVGQLCNVVEVLKNEVIEEQMNR